jgi:hypothetical protein
VPHNWLIVDANTPEPWNRLGKPNAYRAEIEKRVAKYAKFEQIYWDATKPVAYVLVDGPVEPEKLRALAAELPTLDVIQLLDDDELKHYLAAGKKRR